MKKEIIFKKDIKKCLKELNISTGMFDFKTDHVLVHDGIEYCPLYCSDDTGSVLCYSQSQGEFFWIERFSDYRRSECWISKAQNKDADSLLNSCYMYYRNELIAEASYSQKYEDKMQKLFKTKFENAVEKATQDTWKYIAYVIEVNDADTICNYLLTVDAYSEKISVRRAYKDDDISSWATRIIFEKKISKC